MVSEAVGLVVGGTFLSSFLNVLFERIATVQVLKPLINVFRGTKVRDDLLQKMEILLLTVDKVLGDAEEKQITNHSIKKWLDKLKDVAYDAEDLLDIIGFEGQVQEEQVKNFNTRLEQIVSKLELIAAEKDILSLKDGQGRKSISRLPTTSLVDESEVRFRNDDKKQIVDILLSDGENRKGIPVIAILGMGGIGKTTLAQFLYNDVNVKNHFDLRIWVYVSEEFDVFKVTKTIYESATLSHSDIEDLNALQVKLERILLGKKFLLVLDNVWNESSREWDLLRRPLQVGAVGSKIIVTTRSQSVSSIIHDVLVHDLNRLSKEDCWSLFSKHAFGDKDPDEDSTLKEIGEEIVKKCKGLPLAIKTLGSLLHSEAEAEEWNNLLNSRIWDLPDHKSDILPALRLSYHYLPSQLKRCFAYCSIFPKGHKFEKRDLVRMWIAEGLVQQPNCRRTKEEVGEQYFHELLSRSIFQRSHVSSCFIMHDLVNDLAQYIAGEFCFKFEHDSSPQNAARVRHLSCILKPSDTPDKFVAFYEKNKVLRTFLPLRLPSDGKTPFDSRAFKKLFPAPSCLRVLSLSSYNVTEFPDSVGNLKQLRYLDLSGAAIQCLPKTVGCLYNLETLKLSRCHRLTRLPANLSNLTKLEHLDMKGTPILELLDSIGDLKQLIYLDLSGTKIPCLPERICSLYNWQTLKLSRCLHLTCLPTDMENLAKLKHLDMNGTPILELLDSIGILKQLDYLDLSCTKVRCLPERVCSLYNLQTLKLSDCPQLTCLPTHMENLTKLKHLDIKGTPILQMPPKFGNLKHLQLLTTFVVGNNSVSTIGEVKDLSLLRGALCLLRLQNVSQTADAEKANLKDKKHLRELIFEWDADPCNGNAQNAAQNPQNGNAENAVDDHNDNGNAQNAAHDHQNGNTENAVDDLNDNGNAQNAADYPHDCNGQTAVNDHNDNGIAQNAAEYPHDFHGQNAVNDPLNGNAQNAADDPSNGNLKNAENSAADNPHNGNAQTAQSAMDSPQSSNGQSAAEGDLQNSKAKHASNVLDKLQPGENLERLEIKNFFGIMLPKWLGDASFSNMKCLTLDNCQNCNSPPPLGQLPSLEELFILDLGGVKTVGYEFYGSGVVAFKSLETLMFKKMENWEEWRAFTNERGFPSLGKLCMSGCGKLTGDLPIQRPGLKLQIEGCNGLRYDESVISLL